MSSLLLAESFLIASTIVFLLYGIVKMKEPLVDQALVNISKTKKIPFN